ncbi:glycerophosphodiester phosphodiesterase family protein [Qipengyuania marisflavi]|uniref:glycerophosphodiester phosphodiesterase n=1 Tax=Qipengyuania marisflavi TaxID=2486356 RepID=A0A5S3P1T3_9SPHN|nr:glycerophosphodiester phosphodiesterase family protein [Qipengyuania marisflavi]TMM46572.1 glycerophosphodiester phosphodiesterase [Qipengyuania marisflavi]
MTTTFSAFGVKIRLSAALLAVLLGLAAQSVTAGELLVIAHRGASGERPEHTLAAFERAIDQGADYIEPDLVVTSDNILVVRHENELSDTTDVAAHEEFADRRRSKTVDGELVNGWFAEDFTLAELRTLRARERIPGLRPANAHFDGLYPVPTLAEVLQLVRAKEAESGRRIGIYPELKHPTFLLEQGFDIVDLLVTALRKADLDDADDLVFVQSFEVGPLQRLNRMVEVPLVLLVKPGAGPADEPAMRYEEMLTPSGLAEIATYADAIGADLRLLLTGDGVPTGTIAAAQGAGLKVHVWTLRHENAFLPPIVQRGTGESAPGDLAGLVGIVKAAGVDGVFTDHPAVVVRAAERWDYPARRAVTM